jgi:serine/threonine protein kinase
LSTLRLVQHANIVRLVTTFEYRNTYNLLFEPAEYSLKELLSKDTRPPLWRNDVSFFIALQGLASALATLHDFHVSELNVQHIGCHHDLKPANVLVKNGTFLLADFGLSRLKPLEGDSKTLFRGVSYHNAPECLDFDAGYSSSQIGRKSDVWALGTIMLDIVTYILRGPRGLDDFEKNRKHKIGAITFYYFHHGGHDHPIVLSHIQDLKTEALASWQPIFTLIRSTLQVDQHHRPAASHLVASLSFAVLKIQGLSVLSRLEEYAMSVEVNQINIELITLRIWTTLVGLRDTAGNWSNIAKATRDEVDFVQFSTRLSELDFTLCGLDNIGTRPTVGSVRQLTRHVDHLVEGLNIANRSKLNNLLEIELLQGITVKNWPDLSHTQWPSATTSFSLLAAAKVVAQQDDAQALGLHSAKELDKEKIKDQRAFGSQSEMAILEDQVSTPILIEWIQYDRKWLGDVGKELLQRVRALASVLHTEPKPAGFSVLHCLGFYHAKERHSFGLVFNLPTHATQLKTLKQLLTEIPTQAFAARPSLGHVFMLSSALANSILQFHKVNWLHKEISVLLATPVLPPQQTSRSLI